jgi:hypothetical protein
VLKLFDYVNRLVRERMKKTPSTHEEIAARGAIPPPLLPDYEESLHVLDSVVRDCLDTSHKHGGILAPSQKHFYASVLFTALVTRGVSLVILAPHSKWSEKLVEHWDYASAAGIARTIVELRAAFHYLCIDSCPDDEWDCRWNLLNLHDCTSRIRLFTESPNNEPEQIAGLTAQAEELKSRLRSNAHFKTLPKQKQLLHGQTAYLYSLEDILEKAGTDKQTYRFLNVLFSSAVHGLPMSYYRIGEQDRGRGIPSPIESGYTTICHALAAELLAASRDEIRELFKSLPKQ